MPLVSPNETEINRNPIRRQDRMFYGSGLLYVID